MSDGSMVRGADIVARTLERIAVDRIFSVSGNHVMPVYDALIDTRIELVHARHEAACVHMADAYARTTGQVGVALVTGGPGHTNAIAALYTAIASESPMMLLSGHASLAEIGRGAFQELRQADMAVPVTKAAWTLESARSAGHDIARAARIARSGRPGPVHVSLPVDVLDEEVASSASLWPDATDALAETLPMVDSAADAVLAHLDSARRPLILCGPTLCGFAGRARMARLEDRVGVPVFGMESPRGINDPDHGAFAEILARADLIVLIGKGLDFTLRFGDAPIVSTDCSFIVVDPDAAQLARIGEDKGGRVLLRALADSFSAIQAIADRSPPPGPVSSWLDDVRRAVAFRPVDWKTRVPASAGAVHPLDLCAVLQAFFHEHPEATLVCDGGEIGQWPQSMVRTARRLINGVAGEIGPALPYALAVKCARPQHPVIAVVGDGTFGYHMAELDTAVRHGLPVIVIVGNDARWSAEYRIQVRDYGSGRAKYCELLPSRYDLVAEALGAHGELVADISELVPALRRAVASNRPACINVMIESIAAPTVKRPQGQD
jgi:acetolactate synthase I/II/III large subunit